MSVDQNEKNEIRNKIVSLVSKQLNVPESSITADATIDSLGADSLDRVEIVMRLEEEFKLEINDEDAEKLNTIDDAVNYIYNLKHKSS
ncbi:acyl carrier protein [Candidatus Babela massiliensis]|uniref:Acyl carrier protein n=1 Tax=Candidatus Babela massiliensis TaxID=673862 RepID=V6DIS3_9BACT|nr:acyl carrier protein [Candidatus Babela massiliensis]CDK30431.1 Acyl carrier protein [Candidatus Babela massiliensis]